MATAPVQNSPSVAPPAADGAPQKKSRRRKTSHLKIVPPTRELRDQLRQTCARVAARLDKSRPLTKDEMESVVRAALVEAGQPEGYVGWMMVVLASEFWRDQVAAVPPSRRLFLLPHCLKHAEGCPADYDEFGLECKKCGACSIADFRGLADEMGYKVLVAEGSPIVLKIIVSGYVDAIVGVACLNVLEKAIDKILLASVEQAAYDLVRDGLGAAVLVGDDADSERWRSEYLYSRAATIYGGSAEIQRNIVARRLLDLGDDR